MRIKKLKIKQGFTIIELAISSAILAVIFGGITIFGIQIIKTYQRTQALKNTIENASYAIENLNKTIRTSHTIDGGGSEIFVIDNNTSRSYCYAFNGNKLEIKVGTDSDSDCSDIGASFAEIVGDNSIDVSGSFSVKETDRSVGERGFVRTNIELRYVADALDNFEDDVVVIQSSVSLRDYGYNVP